MLTCNCLCRDVPAASGPSHAFLPFFETLRHFRGEGLFRACVEALQGMHRHDAHADASSLMQLTSIPDFAHVQEELAAGLHLIDFEQLKIENQSLNEKIEERNEELLKLRKKTTSTVQVGVMVMVVAFCFRR